MVNLYWCSTDDHAEDWFIIAENKRYAARFFAGFKGYEEQYIHVEKVCRVPASIGAKNPTIPDHNLIERCGGRFLSTEQPRVVEIAGRKFVEGLMDTELARLKDDLFDAQGRGRPGGTKPETDN